ncbi:hypothetical protein MY11210_009384 [Beauveria gryllotalpidicola]
MLEAERELAIRMLKDMAREVQYRGADRGGEELADYAQQCQLRQATEADQQLAVEDASRAFEEDTGTDDAQQSREVLAQLKEWRGGFTANIPFLLTLYVTLTAMKVV